MDAGGVVVVVSDLLPFDQQSAESARVYAAFVIYRDLGPQRSLEEVSRRVAKSLPHIKRLSVQYNWVDRARSYDAAIDARARAATEQATIDRRRQMLERHAQTAQKLQDSADMILDELNDRLKVHGGMKNVNGQMLIQLALAVPKMLDTGQKLERLAEGEPTDRHEHTITLEQAQKMSDDELDEALREMNLL